MNLCQNLNHRKTNVTIRYCPQCGVVVNESVPKGACRGADHAAMLRQHQTFCMHCGSRLGARS